MKYTALLPLLTLFGCTNLAVREPICEPPPIPAALMQPCALPEPLPDGKMATLYLQLLRDTDPWGQCLRSHDRLIEVVKYRDSVCAKIKADNAKPKPWYQWWD